MTLLPTRPVVLDALPDRSNAGLTEDLSRLTPLSSVLGYRFARPALLRWALTLSSWSNENQNTGWPGNGCLEFFGDAVLGLVTADSLWRSFPDGAEGELTRMRASLVSERTLAQVAEEIRLGEWLYLGRGDAKRGGRENAATLADTLEAVIGAVFLDARDAGVDPMVAVENVFLRLLGSRMADLRPEEGLHPKSRLQHWAQDRYRVTPVYIRIGEKPPADDPCWRARVELRHPDGSVQVLGEGEGRSLRTAERAAAQEALQRLPDHEL